MGRGRRGRVSEQASIGNRNHVRCLPGKGKCCLELDEGATLFVNENTFNRKDSVELELISPDSRWRYLPTVTSGEEIISEVYSLTCSNPPKQPLIISLPVAPQDWTVCEPRVKIRDTGQWTEISEVELAGSKVSTLLSNISCECCVTAARREERLTVPVAGLLYNARLNSLLSIRFPKKVVDRDLPVSIQITKIDQQRLADLQEQHSYRCGDVLKKATIFVDICPGRPATFRRAVTVKLPLPDYESSEFNPNDPRDTMCVLFQNDGAPWTLVDTPFRFTRETVSFEVKTLSRYCVALTHSLRFRRLPEAVSLLSEELEYDRGEAMCFVRYEKRRWWMALQLTPVAVRQQAEDYWCQRGYKYVPLHEPQQTIVEEKSDEQKLREHFQSRRRVRFERPEEVDTGQTQLKLRNHCIVYYELAGNVRVCQECQTSLPPHGSLHYQRFLSASPVLLEFEPRKNDPAQREAVVEIFDSYIPQQRVKLQTCRWQIPETVMEEFFAPQIETPPPEEDKKTTIEIPDPSQFVTTERPARSQSSPATAARKGYSPRNQSSFLRLTTPSREPLYLDKEPRVLSGRSFKALATAVPQGLTLAVHLNLTDSSITGIGFDALANNSSLNGVTYRILMYWKRWTASDDNAVKVEQLANAYKEMGHSDLATLILRKMGENRDIEIIDACGAVRRR